MKILFLIYHGFSEYSGISKKIHSQIAGLRTCGHEVHVCSYLINDNGHRVRMIDDEILQDFGTSQFASLKQRACYGSIINYVKNNCIEFVYSRSFHNANPFTIHLFKQLREAGVKSVMEIPTYPYDSEYVGFSFLEKFNLFIDKLFRKRLAHQLHAIVTFTNFNTIFGQRTIQISNGLDFDQIPLKLSQKRDNPEINLIGVAEVHYWHGFDRLIAGLGEYYTQQHQREIFFHIVGDVGPSEMYNSIHAPGFHELIEKYGLQEQVIFHGQMFGKELDDLFEKCDMAIGSLARHRSGIDNIKTLKNREYAARGLNFIYSETDDDFEKMPYILKIPANETPVNIKDIIKFYEQATMPPIEIRDSIKHLSWNEQMNIVLIKAAMFD
ncbi:MAG: glycosyltransferase family 1 protein [Bacteroidales bacterium]|nr:glycosyltransferase family 1 protein [Bacteroidales bacterium]